MKKLLSFMMLAALLLVSCVQEEKFSDEQSEMATVTFNVTAADIQTKAFGDGSLAGGAETGELIVQAFNLSTEGVFELTEAEITITGPTDKTWAVTMKLAKNETYKIAFWAQKKNTGIYDTEDLRAVSVDYSKIALNSDDADAFCAARYLTVTGALSETVELYRPLAQINLGTNDRVQYNKSVTADKRAISAKVTLPAGVPATLNVIGEDTDVEAVPTAKIAEFTEEAIVKTGDALVNNVLTADAVNYDYLAMVYVLAAPETKIMDFSATFANATNPNINTVAVPNMPFQANYKTNVLGQLLTGTMNYTVVISPEFATPDYNIVISSQEELNEVIADINAGENLPAKIELAAEIEGTVLDFDDLDEPLSIPVEVSGTKTVTIENLTTNQTASGVGAVTVTEGASAIIEGSTIQSTGSNPRGVIVAEDAELVVKGSSISVGEGAGGNYPRALQVNATGAKVTVEESEISSPHYPINLTSTSGDSEMTFENTTITGWSILNIWSSGNTFTLKNCVLNSVNDKTYNADGWNNFAAFVFNQGGHHNTINVNNCITTVSATTGNKQSLLSLRDNNNTVLFNGGNITGTDTNVGPVTVSSMDNWTTANVDFIEMESFMWNGESQLE